MRIRLGLALLFALIAIVPFALATEWSRDTIDTVIAQGAAERADEVADAWRVEIDRRLALIEARAQRRCGPDLPPLPGEAVVDPASRISMIVSSAPGPAGPWSSLGSSRSVARTIACARATDVSPAFARAAVPAEALVSGAPPHGAGDVEAIVLGEDATADTTERGVERRIVRAFDAEDGVPSVRIAVSIPEAALAQRERAQVELRLQILALATLLIALALGFLVGGRLTRPLGELERAAERIGRGDLEVRIDRGTGSAGATFSAFNRMARELREAQTRARRAERVAAWRDIARRIAHEIKNPLTPIRMSIETMRRTKQRAHPDFDEIFDESTRTVLEEVERLERIVTEFSRFARLPRPRPTLLDVREVVASVVQLHSPGGDATITDTSPRLPIKMSLADDVPRVRANRDQLVQVLVNLVQNAIDAATSKHESDGHVEVAVEGTEDGDVRVTVSDDGPGIPEEERAQVLEPYYTTKAKGTGLGLSIVDRIVTEHGGAIEIGESRAGGAAFSFTLTPEGPPEEADASQSS